jgi:hypothetical protein
MGDDDTTKPLTAMQVAREAVSAVAATQETLTAQERTMQEIRSELESLRTMGAGTAELDGVLARLEEAEKRLASQAGSVDYGPAVADLSRKVTAFVEEFDAKLQSLQGDKLNEQDTELGQVVEDVAGQANKLSADFQGLANELAHVNNKIQGLDDGLAHVNNEVGHAWSLIKSMESAIHSPGHLAASSVVPGVYGKVLELMRAVGPIGKDQEVKPRDGQKGPRYNFRGIDTVMDAVGAAQRDVGILIVPGEVKRYDVERMSVTGKDGYTTVWTSVNLVAQYVFIDPSDGSVLPFEIAGEGRDNGDKATSKAESMALKYGLLQALMIPVTGMAEADDEHPEITQQPSRPAKPPAERAAEGLQAIRALPDSGLSQGEQVARLDAMYEYANGQGLLDEVVEGGRLRMHFAAAKGTYEERAQAEHDGQTVPEWNEYR